MFTDEMKSMIVENSHLYKDKVMDLQLPSPVMWLVIGPLKFFQMLHLLQLIS